MVPSINKGDVVIVEKINGKFDSLSVGDVISFNYGNVIIVHRIVNIVSDGKSYFFYTKGDANKNVDNYAIKEGMVNGIIRFKIPFIGLPTVWLNEM